MGEQFIVQGNIPIAKDIFEMTLMGNTFRFTSPGQFAGVAVEGYYLRRPISVCDLKDDELTLVYRVVGRGTEAMSRLLPGEKLDLLTGLGNGFHTKNGGEHPLLIGGGIGVPPLYLLAKRLVSEGKRPTVALGFNGVEQAILQERFAALGIKVLIATMDGSQGERGFVTQAIQKNAVDYDFFYACGPEPMLKAVCETCNTPGELSFEARMACGFGACMGCTCKTKLGNKRVCCDGPVFSKEEVLWQT